MTEADHDLEIVQGSDNVFRDVGLPEPDAKLVKADVAAAIIEAQRNQSLAHAAAAKRAGVQEADISRIRNADLNRFTIDRLTRIAQSLDPQVHLVVAYAPVTTRG